MAIKDVHHLQRAALVRLFQIAQRDTGQSKKVADFLLAWHNASENGGWNPVDIWAVDVQIARDIVTALVAIRVGHAYPPELGFEVEIARIWKQWRGEGGRQKEQ